MLKVENLNTGYGKRQVLYDVAFEINPKEIAILIGANGSGKSTILKYIYGLITTFGGGTGKVIFNGEDITGIATFELLKKGLVYVQQKNNVFENLTVKENLEVAGISLKDKKLFKKREIEVLKLFPILSELLRRYPVKLSGGEKQLLALAMASLHKPKMIFIDEPFAGLSYKNVEIIKDHINRMNKEFGITFLIVEHNVKKILSITNKIIGLKLGKIITNMEINSNFDIGQLEIILI